MDLDQQSKELTDISKSIPVLDGFVELINVSSDQPEKDIVRSARVSYALDQTKSTITGDKNLLEFMLSERHTSPFECVSFTFHIKVPLSIATQILRHRTAKVNCVSHRYTKAEDGRFDPVKSVYDVRYQSDLNRQTSVTGEVDENTENIYRLYMKQMELAEEMYKNYEEIISFGGGREQARFYLPCGTYTRMYWTMDLHNLMHFLELRLAPDAQYEVRVYAEAILKLIEPLVPTVFRAFRKYRLNSISFNEEEIRLLKTAIKGDDFDISLLGSKRRQKVFLDKISKIQ